MKTIVAVLLALSILTVSIVGSTGFDLKIYLENIGNVSESYVPFSPPVSSFPDPAIWTDPEDELSFFDQVGNFFVWCGLVGLYVNSWFTWFFSDEIPYLYRFITAVFGVQFQEVT